MIPPKRVDIFPPDWGMLRGLDASKFFYKRSKSRYTIPGIFQLFIRVPDYSSSSNVVLEKGKERGFVRPPEMMETLLNGALDNGNFETCVQTIPNLA